MKPYQALIWNEWRQMRNSAMTLGGVTVLLWLLMLAGCSDKAFVEYIEMGAFALAIGLPFLYCIVLADSFAREFDQKTDSFLLELPVSPSKIFFCKYFANLAVFLVLVALEVELMRLTPGRHFDGLHFEDGIMASVTLVLIWILAHAMVFLTSVLGKKTGNGIVAIIILPLPVMLLLPGTMAATMFFAVDETTWYATVTLLTLLALYGSCIGLSWYLWTCRISRGRKIFKPIATAFCLLLVLPWVLYGMAYCYTALELNSAIRAAKDAGMKQVFEPPVPPSASSQAAVAVINKLSREYEKRILHDKSLEMGLFERYERTRKFSFSQAEQAKLSKTADTILNTPEMCHFSNIMGNIQKSTDFRFMPYYQLDPAQIDWNAYLELEIICINWNHLLSHKATALLLKGDEKVFFECLGEFDPLLSALRKDTIGSWKAHEINMLEKKLSLAAIGPDTPEAAKYYEQYLKDIDGIAFLGPDTALFVLECMKSSDFIPRLMPLRGTVYEVTHNTLGRCLYLPRLQQSQAAWLKLEIRKKELIECTRQAASYPEIKADAYRLDQLSAKIPGLLKLFYGSGYPRNYAVIEYFYHKSRFEHFKICLALKIYRARHGKFPDSMQQLVPGILPKVPINPFTGTDFGYRTDKDGFILFMNPNETRGSFFEYHPLKTMEKTK
ncbi:MAG: hypothetical protein WCV67_09640 [Victivallaceae bacterium]